MNYLTVQNYHSPNAKALKVFNSSAEVGRRKAIEDGASLSPSAIFQKQRKRTKVHPQKHTDISLTPPPR
ncbi:hypothetical protein AVEN_132352-1, partial [Araneus ventricosus]